jgi:hypothetical protein
MKPVKYAGLIAAVLALGALAAMPAFAQEELTTPPITMGTLTLSITNDGIMGMPEQTPTGGGLYLVTVKNDSNVSRGIVMTGVDLCCSPYMRFTKVLKPGQEVSFRWFFPSDRTVQFRDLIRCRPVARTCGLPKAGSLASSLVFG